MKYLLIVSLFALSCGSLPIPNPCSENPARCVDQAIEVLEQFCKEIDPDAGVVECVQDIVEANK